MSEWIERSVTLRWHDALASTRSQRQQIKRSSSTRFPNQYSWDSQHPIAHTCITYDAIQLEWLRCYRVGACCCALLWLQASCVCDEQDMPDFHQPGVTLKLASSEISLLRFNVPMHQYICFFWPIKYTIFDNDCWSYRLLNLWSC